MQSGNNMNSGFITINKPKGITSFGVISRLRRITGIKKIGHAGTLDPLATGVLICAIGREATKRIDTIQGQDKQYKAEITFGATSDTYDVEGVITKIEKAEAISLKDLEQVLPLFIGTIEQTPPIYSAKKIGGTAAYKLARQGKEVVLRTATVEIKSIKIISYEWPVLRLKIDCGKGTYIRSIAHDLGEELGVGGYLTALERTRIGVYTVEDSHALEDLSSDNWSKKLFQI